MEGKEFASELRGKLEVPGVSNRSQVLHPRLRELIGKGKSCVGEFLLYSGLAFREEFGLQHLDIFSAGLFVLGHDRRG